MEEPEASPVECSFSDLLNTESFPSTSFGSARELSNGGRMI